MLYDDIPTRVAKGVALLDENKPGWVGLIDLDHLALHSPQSCVLGQVYGGYYTGLKELGFYDDKWDFQVDDARFGFDAGHTMGGRSYEFQLLQAEWVRVLTILRQKNEAKGKELVRCGQ